MPERSTSWHTFLRAHWGAIVGADFFTTEVWTWRGLVTFYTVFVIELASRRVEILGSTPHPDEAFMRQVARTLRHARPLDQGGMSRSPDSGRRPALSPAVAEFVAHYQCERNHQGLGNELIELPLEHEDVAFGGGHGGRIDEADRLPIGRP